MESEKQRTAENVKRMRTLKGEVFTECKFVLEKEDMRLWQIALLEGRRGSVVYPLDREGTVRLKKEEATPYYLCGVLFRVTY